MSLKDTFKKEWFMLLILAAPFIASIILWSDMPDIVPIHFNAQGEADDYGPKWINALLLPAIALCTYLFLVVIPKLDPKNKISSTQKSITAIRIVITLFLVGVYVLVMMKTFEMDADIGQFIFLAVGVLIMVTGNYMNSIKSNYFIGIRTPWTLENPEVWKRTHRFSSKLWVIGGFLMAVSTFVPGLSGSVYIIIGAVIILAIVPLIHSYVVYKNLNSSNS